MKIWSKTDIGLVRKENQDSFAVGRSSGYTIGVVCDGMGGAAGGQIASKTAAETFLIQVEQVINPGMTPKQLREASSYAVSLANKAVQEAAAQSEDLQHMGTTLVSAISAPEGIVICNVGDSRAYHISESGITQITKDHSLVENMVERGDITAEEARHHPNRNLITRALGADTVSTCDGYLCRVAQGEYILLCTDGLTNTVTDQEILFEVIHGADPDTCLERLFAISKERGAPDNVTAVLMRKP